ncbi:hypothetical protein [Spongiimicrobium salis]|uniref:hypothetical protein n=1 Tax=Spongiimicrobium salis TaxID=1667022 RepID=UPI00374D7DE1
MEKNYDVNFLWTFVLLLTHTTVLFSQELKVFGLEDFDLRGKVKTCLVITDYGKEEFDFNEEGLLTKSVTRYSDADYDITYYKYQHGYLLEKRLESYRDGIFDKNTSIANSYSLDTLLTTKITEKIISYNNEFLDQYYYVYDEQDRLVSIQRNNNDGLDETKVTYSHLKGETTQTYSLNGVILKSIRTSVKKKGGEKQRTVLTKEFLEGEPLKAQEQLFGGNKELLMEVTFRYDTEKKQFAPEQTKSFSYTDQNVISEVIIKTGNTTAKKKYIHQFDDSLSTNWIKQIITPENSYVTRRITYYEEEEE